MEMMEIGVQSFTYRQFDIPGIIEEISDTDMTALEIFPGHLSPDNSDEEIDDARQRLEDAGIRICGYGVYSFSSEEPHDVAPNLDFARQLGCDYVSIDVDPGDDGIKELLVEEAQKRDLLLGVHNHGPTHHYDTAQSVLDSVKDFDTVLGACVDTGHFLRADENPEHAVDVLGKRVHAVHLKDFVDAETEVIPGTGKLNYGDMFDHLEAKTNFSSAFIIEYEADPEDPTPGMRQTLGVFKQSLQNR